MYFVPFVPTPYPVVREMLKLAGAGKDDILYDLGCGDGRILVVAVKEFNVKKAVGIERDSERVKEAVRRINEEGISDKAIVIQGDFFETDISEATIVTLFLLTSVNEVLRPKFDKELRDGTRIVSHEFRIPGWKHEKMIEVRDDNGLTHVVYLYIKGRHL
ncbi:protein-lysine N-methyltransferase [Desulfurococcus amylolyticus]|uniref:Putative RNA methylase n=1 Tax=Desulfurococcus amylolyticus (strain DSM 18924 / JCM 16383 / VKM B-2413 / 1221n) TaxID=490899 RepID=B8D6A1_DESA1|nr:protein-lysine N-methyltransferase [Desulfurococcus amylolyticus]ACL11632.1 putative RNA methylase [Desulfurococcus amylolyticus 1221n]